MIPRFAELVDALSDAYDREHAAALLEEFRWSVATGRHLQFLCSSTLGIAAEVRKLRTEQN